MIYQELYPKKPGNKKFALLIDPENYSNEKLSEIIKEANNVGVDYILLGGSLLSKSIEPTASLIKNNTTLPLILFPGNLMQISDHADGILLLSMISGRNPDLLIGNHILAAKRLKESNIEVISTGYILIEGGNTSAVEYISNTKPIPAEQTDIIVSTAIAGELLGHKMIYLESGSGASNSLHSKAIKEVKNNITIPLVVGGGLKEPSDIKRVSNAGADIVVVGNAIEKNPEKLKIMIETLHK
ncbi:MAG: geranylgeranylglyceryl/heptaprenylglyceryl phosphate synthase [Bacteroidota bacterium]